LKKFNVPDQLIRITIAFVLLIGGLIVVRLQFIPPTFGDDGGHYRGAAVEDNVNKAIKYAGWQECVVCHEEQGDIKKESYHRTLSCETCHGPAAKHAEDFESQKPVIPRDREACLFCHRYMPSRPTGFPQVIEMRHNPMEPCVTCHNPHDPRPPETPEDCSACHAQISRTKAISHHNSLDCETCHEAPAEHFENPRAFLPKKPQNREFCGICHGDPDYLDSDIPQVDLESHGGTYLCWQCHYPHFPEGSNE
jgi:hypothetical protein